MSTLIVDYGMGNLSSVKRALEEIGAPVYISGDPAEVKEATSIILPGVGAFGEGMVQLESTGLADALREHCAGGEIPLLGICLGMQLLADRGSEGGDTKGLGLIPGTINRLQPQNEERLPHIGWNEAHPSEEHPMFTDIPSSTDFYFVHSFHFDQAENHTVATTPYAGGLSSVVALKKIWGVQFHPEKSSKAGLQLLHNFVSLHS
ncbi:MAG: imidazole glycerol phosphate synthase subunit HisH [Akkermansiaceae bacterium]